jgi:hypothetical protein
MVVMVLFFICLKDSLQPDKIYYLLNNEKKNEKEKHLIEKNEIKNKKINFIYFFFFSWLILFIIDNFLSMKNRISEYNIGLK